MWTQNPIYFNFLEYYTNYFNLTTIYYDLIPGCGLYLNISKSFCNKLQLFAIFYAVYILSPVNIHTFISILLYIYVLARNKSRIVYGT